MNNEPFYSMANSISCCGPCNAMKSKISLHEFLGKIQRIAKNLDPNVVPELRT